jgi:DNA primase
MEIIEQVRQAASIVEIASQYTTLKRRGRKWVGLCPFHSEKDASFTVDEDKQLYHCFGCGVGGDVFSLVMEKESLNFPEALKVLAEKYRIPLPRRTVHPEVLKLEEKLFQINEQAMAFFRKNLFNTEEGMKALSYLKKRGLGEKTIQALKLGYAANSWNGLIGFFQAKGVAPSLLEKGGLILPGKKRGEYYDRFRGRVIFPIFSLTGKVLAFGGRTVFDAEPKYLNSPDTPLYSKGKLLYGLNFSKESIRKEGWAVLVEGYTDYSALYQAGLTNVVASLGTALTPFQVTQLQRFAGQAIVNYDGDDAGAAAALRAVPIFFEKGLHVRVLTLPDKADPDSFLRKHGPEKYQAFLKKALPGLSFLVRSLSKGTRLDIPEERGRIARTVVKEIEKIPDAVARSEYLKQASEELGIAEEILRRIVGTREPGKGPAAAGHLCPAEKRLFQILMENQAVAPYVFAEADDEIFEGLPSEGAFRYMIGCFRNNTAWSVHGLKGQVHASILSQLSEALIEKSSETSVEEAQECLKSLRKIHLQNRLKDIQQKIARSEKRGEKEETLSLLYQKQDVTKQILSLT